MRYAIGDIHGGDKTFLSLLDRLRLKHSDRLFLMGDYVDYGPGSKTVLDIIIGLMESGRHITPLRGNHDEMMLCSVVDANDDFARSWFADWGESFGIATPGELPEKYINFLKSLPLIAVEQDYVFTHAGLAFDAPDPIAASQPLHMLWQESGVPDRSTLGGRMAITGHLMRSIEAIKLSLESHRIYLDNGAYTGDLPEMGNLVALNLDTKELIVQPWLDGLCC